MIQDTPGFQTKEQYAYQILRKAILHCELAPGEKLIIDRLSTEMGLSQIPIRAAIQRLQAEGLVNITPHSSATVAPISPSKINEIFTLLESLEQAAFISVVGTVDPKDVTVLKELIEQMDIALSNDDSATWLTSNIAFHRKIAELAHMSLLVDFTNRVLNEWERITHFYFENVTSSRLPQAQQEHRQIVSLLLSGDTDSLKELAATHNRAANQAYQAILQKEGGSGSN